MIIKFGRLSGPGTIPAKAEFLSPSDDSVVVLMMTRQDITNIVDNYRAQGPYGLTVIGPGPQGKYPMSMSAVAQWAPQGFDEFLGKVPAHANPIEVDGHAFSSSGRSGLLVPDEKQLLR